MFISGIVTEGMTYEKQGIEDEVECDGCVGIRQSEWMGKKELRKTFCRMMYYRNKDRVEKRRNGDDKKDGECMRQTE